MGDYNISKAFEKIEDELIASMMRNMKRHKVQEVKEDKQWSMWQAEQLKSLEKYKVQNRETFGSTFGGMNRSMGEMIRASKQEGGMKQEVRIMQAIKKGFKVSGKNAGGSPSTSANFFQLNEKKLDTLIKATTSDMQKAETAILRRANDQYRKVIYSAQVYANIGAGTYAKAVDMATKDMLSVGLNCVEYANGARHTAADYADMAIKTANKRAYLMGEGEKRKEWGIHTVIINKRGNPCPKCLPFVGKVFIDDVWSGGSAADGDYPLLSQAISMGLYHPRCKDSHNTYFPGISPEPEEKFTKQEMDDIEQNYRGEQKKNYATKQAERFGRISKYSLDDENKSSYQRKASTWKGKDNKYNSFEELENSIKKKYNVSVDKDVRDLNIQQVSKTMEEFEQVISDYPTIAGSFTGINTATLRKAAFAPNGELTLNPKYYKQIDKNLIGTGYHEAGHLIELSLIKKKYPKTDLDMICNLYKKGEEATDVVDKSIKRIRSNKSREELIEEISEYALKNDSETVAEAIKDYYMNGNLANLLSRQIIKALKEELK